MRSDATRDLTGRRVLVTGGRGFLGRWVCRLLEAAGAEVRVLDLACGVASSDIRFPLDPAAFGPVDVVVHLAALAGVRPSLHNPAAYVATNVVGTSNVLALARELGVDRVVLASSSSVYGECREPVQEHRTLAPMSPYAATKMAMERVARAERGHFEQVLVRPFTVYGPGQRPDMVVHRLLCGEALTLWPFTRDFTYVEDVADAIVAACWRPLDHDLEVLNLGSGSPISARGLLDAIAHVTGRRPDVTWGPPLHAEPQRTWADPTRAVDLLGFRPSRALVEGIASQFAAVRPAPTPAGVREAVA